jgi:hypothetical protein
VKYEVTSQNGEVVAYDVTIHVKEAPKPPVPNAEKPI